MDPEVGLFPRDRDVDRTRPVPSRPSYPPLKGGRRDYSGVAFTLISISPSPDRPSRLGEPGWMSESHLIIIFFRVQFVDVRDNDSEFEVWIAVPRFAGLVGGRPPVVSG